MGRGKGAQPATLDSLDTAAVARFREALHSAGYDLEQIRVMLRSDGDGVLPRPEDVPVVTRLLPTHHRLADLMRLFLLTAPLDEDDARAALAPLTLDDALRLGVVERSGAQVLATIRVIPVATLLVASDRMRETSADLPTDHVMGVATSSNFLASLTIRRPVRDALDMGCGTGIQAILAARHARRVVACDINARALMFTTFNAALNGVENVECRAGSFFEPVEGQTFDLIVSNPPFVISPDTTLTFRDGGMRGDDVSRHVVREAAAHLADGGTAFVLVSWGVAHGEEWDAPLRRWVEGRGCDAWFLHHARGTPLAYAATWNSPLQETDPAAYEAAIDRWLGHYRELGYDSIGYGAVILRKRVSRTHWVRADDIHGQREPGSHEQIAHIIAAEDFLAGHDAHDLLDVRLTMAPRQRLDQVLHARDGAFVVDEATLRLEDGLRFTMQVNAFTAALLTRLDGSRTLREASIAAAGDFASDGLSATDAAEESVRIASGLLRKDFVRFS